MTSWSDEHIQQLKSLWGEGDSASIIAAKLPGNYTRNAVLGKIHRMEIQNGIRRQPRQRKETEQSPKAPPARRTPSLALVRTPSEPKPRRLPPPPPRLILSEPVPTGKVTIMDLSDKTCRWPIGEPGGDSFHFCGSAKDSDAPTPYCPYHAQKAVAPYQPKKFTPSAFQNSSGRRLVHVG